MKKWFRRKRYRVLAATLILISIPAVGALALQWKLYRRNLTVAPAHFPNGVNLSSGTRALVIAPHCDDETLGCGGMIARIIQRKGSVTVVVVTNGDGSRSTAVRQYRRWKPRPDQIEQMARMRQKETLRALRVLGVSSSHVVFLGYPDGGLARMWERNWEATNAYTSPFTQTAHNPYSNSFRPRSVYCGQSVLFDIREIIERVKPTDLFVTHPNDTHGDHWASYAFTCAALESLRTQEPSLKKTRLWGYLIHRDGGVAESVKLSWPAPAGLHRDLPLVPPEKLLNTDTKWHQVPLDDSLVERKRLAALCYESQIKTMKRFLLAFVRKNELFGTLNSPVFDDMVASGPAEAVDRASMVRVVRDATHDGFARDIVPQGDFKEVRLLRNGKQFQVQLELYGRPSSRIQYQVEINGIDETGEFRRTTFLMAPSKRLEAHTISSPSAHFVGAELPVCTADGHVLSAGLPGRFFDDSRVLLVCARSRLGSLRLDRTAVRVVRCGIPPHRAFLSRSP